MAAFIRIFLRYVAGVLIAHGVFSDADANQLISDPELVAAIEVGLGVIVGIAVEWWYAAARRFGWAK
ncbi:MAG: hypothetical protein AAF903_12210 [Pseudomonadota bacterium]